MLLLLWIAAYACQYCVYTQATWRVVLSNDTLCGVAWSQLMAVNASSLLVTQNQAWVVAFHQYAAAALNQRRLWAAAPSPATPLDFDASGLSDALGLLGDTLERTCTNLSLWQWTPQLDAAFALLRAFNQGAIPGAEACADEFAALNTSASPFYYYGTPGDWIVWNPATNATERVALLDGLYSSQAFGALVILVLAALGVFLGLRLLSTRAADETRTYTLQRKEAAARDDETEMTWRHESI